MYVHCLGYLYQMMKNAMGYTSTNNCAKPSCFPSNSICQHNQNSEMCWHDPEHIRIYLLFPDYDAPLIHIQSVVQYSIVLISYNAIATADRNLASIVMYPPKINRKNYCTAENHSGPKMMCHNVLPELGSLFPQCALIFNILIKFTVKSICGIVVDEEFLINQLILSNTSRIIFGTTGIALPQNCQGTISSYLCSVPTTLLPSQLLF